MKYIIFIYQSVNPSLGYRKRIVDAILERKLSAFGAVLICGPRGCGKTTTAKAHSKSFVEFQDEESREMILSVASTMPSKLLNGERPRLFDEWQDAPKIWGTVRKSVDDLQQAGQYILTGSDPSHYDVPHTGTMRISRMRMYPMSLFESGESNGSVSLKELFDNPEKFDGCHSDLSIDGIIRAVCRGGWPQSLDMSETDALKVAKSIFEQICDEDSSNVDGVSRKSSTVRQLLRSYSRNICQYSDNKTVMADVRSSISLSDGTYYDYMSILERLFIISDVDSWHPAIRPKTVVRSSKKKNLVDPSIAVAALGISPSYFDTDFITLGFLFESLAIRDLRAYSSSFRGTVSCYHDRYGLEADAVLHLPDGRYALFEVALGQNGVDKSAKDLLKIESLVRKHNGCSEFPMKMPNLKIVITGTEYGYRRDDGVYVIPLACLRD